METKPGGRGDFVVKADGALLWDKKRRDGDRFPQHDEILRQLGKGCRAGRCARGLSRAS